MKRRPFQGDAEMVEDPVDVLRAAAALGRERLIARHPEFERHADGEATDEVAQALGVDRTELYRNAVDREIERYAGSLGRDVMEVLLSMGANSVEQERELLDMRQQGLDEGRGS